MGLQSITTSIKNKGFSKPALLTDKQVAFITPDHKSLPKYPPRRSFRYSYVFFGRPNTSKNKVFGKPIGLFLGEGKF